jgi:hypothetical protein
MGAPFGLRVRVRLNSGRLDRQIAAGHPVEGVAELSLRAERDLAIGAARAMMSRLAAL